MAKAGLRSGFVSGEGLPIMIAHTLGLLVYLFKLFCGSYMKNLPNYYKIHPSGTYLAMAIIEPRFRFSD
jgi:hypothetical protein